MKLEKACLEVERQHKALAFEEDLHQQHLAQLNADARARQLDQSHGLDDDEDGEISSEAKEVSLLFSAILQKEIAAIFEGKFNPTNLYKLHRKVTLSIEDEEEISVSGGKLRAKKCTGTAKNYPHSNVWSASFLQYIAVLSHFEKYSGLTHPLINFHACIMELLQTYL